MFHVELTDYTKKLEQLSERYSREAVDSVFVPAANEFLATIKNRISQEGRNSQGAPIGQYSTKPGYFGTAAFIRRSSFSPRGKTGEKVFKNGRPHKTEYIPTGYKGLREKQGRRTEVMNMSYSGGTLLSYQMQARQQDVVIGMTNNEAAEIRHGQEKKRGRIFYGTQEEIGAYTKNVRDESEKLHRQLLK